MMEAATRAEAAEHQTEPSISPAAPADLVADLADTLDVMVDQPLASMTLFGGDPPTIDRYTIERRLGAGATAVVYAARDTTLDRPVALKIMAGRDAGGAWRARAHREARALARLDHPNVVAVHDVGEWQGHPFITMELVVGMTLARWQTEEPRAWPAILRHYLAAGRGLEAAHSVGLVHRDFKPANVLVARSGSVLVTDFGLAALVEPAALTAKGGIGTPAYLAPEQREGAPPQPSADVYSFSVALCEALMGRHPVLASAADFRRIPRRIRATLDRGMAPDVAQRWQHMGPLLAAITAALPAPASRRRRAAGIALVLTAGLASDQGGSRSEDPGDERTAVVASPSLPARPSGAHPTDESPDYEAIRKHALGVLRAALDQAEPAVRVQSADALGRIKDQSSVPMLTVRAETDHDEEVRAQMAVALGEIGAASTSPLLRKLEVTASLSLKIRYAAALARLGDRSARERLIEYVEQARHKDLRLWLVAGLDLAELSQPSDPKALQALQELAAHADELEQATSDEYVGVQVLRHLAALRYAPARKDLYALLEDAQEGARLAAAGALAKLGDGAGKKVFEQVLADDASPYRLLAAVAQIPLGEYGGFDLITSKLDDKDPQSRRIAARALGELGAPASLNRLQKLANDQDWTLRIAAAEAIVAIVGLDPLVLAHASVGWTKSALDSQDWRMRRAAASVLADIPEQEALPLLAEAIADMNPSVRLEATKSAGKMKSAEVAAMVTSALKDELNLEVKERQIKTLGEIGNPAAHDALMEIANTNPGRIGVIAAGSLIAVGDASGKAKLEVAASPSQPAELRLAAMEAAVLAKDPIVVPTLRFGVEDRVFAVRFAAAEELASFNAERHAAVKVLNEALESRDADVIGRALAALTRLGEQAAHKVKAAEMIDSADPKVRLAAVSVARALPPSEGVQLLRRLLADPDQDVRRASVDAIESITAKDKSQAIKLYKSLVGHADPIVRSKASGQLAKAAATAPGATPTAPPVDNTLPKVRANFALAAAAATKAKFATQEFEALLEELASRTARQPRDATALKHVGKLATRIAEAAMKLESVAVKTEAAAVAAADAASPNPSEDAAKLLAATKSLAEGAAAAAAVARSKVPAAEKQARRYIQAWTEDAQILISTARAAMIGNNFTEAKENLDKAAQLLRASKASSAEVDYLYVELYVGLGDYTLEPATKRKYLQQAKTAFEQLKKTGTSSQVKTAGDLLTALADELRQTVRP
jgi:serine/threonine protein kinase